LEGRKNGKGIKWMGPQAESLSKKEELKKIKDYKNQTFFSHPIFRNRKDKVPVWGTDEFYEMADSG